MSSVGYLNLKVWIISPDNKTRFPTTFRTDVAHRDVPLLISYQALADWKCVLVIQKGIIITNQSNINVHKSKSCHIFARMELQNELELRDASVGEITEA